MSSTHFLSLRGSPALSAFRLEKLYASLKNPTPSIVNIYAEFVHFVFSESALSSTQQNILEQILTYGAVNDTLQTNIHAASGDAKIMYAKIELFLLFTTDWHPWLLVLNPFGVTLEWLKITYTYFAKAFLMALLVIPKIFACCIDYQCFNSYIYSV